MVMLTKPDEFRQAYGPYDRTGSHKKIVIYRLRTVPAYRWLAPPRHVVPLISIQFESDVPDNYPEDYKRRWMFIQERDAEGKDLKPPYMIDLFQTPAPESRIIKEIGIRWQSGYPGKPQGEYND